MRKKGTPEFFEVFRRLPEAEKSRSWWTKKSQPAAQKTPVGGVRDATTPSGRVALTFSREALAIFVPLLIGALVTAHIWGYRRGVNTMAAQARVPAQQARENLVAQRPAEQVEQRTLSLPAVNPVSAPFWTLQIVSVVSGQAQTARDLAASLRADGYDAFVRKSGSGYNVSVGRFKELSAAKASGLKERFAPMTYKGQRNLFKSCLYVQVTDTGSIVR